MSYEAAKTRAEPYNKIVEELPEIQLENVELVKRAVSEKRTAYVPVNNRGEGNAPLTIQALRNALQAAGPRLVRMTVTQVEERHLAAPARCSSRHRPDRAPSQRGRVASDPQTVITPRR